MVHCDPERAAQHRRPRLRRVEWTLCTEKEQEQLLNLLSARINDTRLKTKINYIKQLVRERKNIGLDLIDIIDNEEAINEIHSKAEKQLAAALNSYSGIISRYADREIVFISLCLIAMLKYDGNYYDYVADTYKNIYRKYNYFNISLKLYISHSTHIYHRYIILVILINEKLN